MNQIPVQLALFAITLATALALGATAEAQGYGPHRIGHVSFLAEPGVAYTILSDCSIEANGVRVAQVRPSYDPNIAWIYYIPRTGHAYPVDYGGSVWSNPRGLQVIGHAVWNRAC